ncbi:helix-turn-helix domain-containing protein [Christiangramia echinicola]|uniref:Bacteriophage CI repressor helix-turn-helix domain-containing protein n=1 Tax=Christiangramia echinicola TaxID=279359 RepID=A0A1H1S4S7_9FLAO|nr:helix-turn-helix transcriptional regulator [Christiangramia echinicola]SDS43002.1 Bacteriophage CI repressor helix-turn-helix domain-containing protein [Christiangramia echinicola]
MVNTEKFASRLNKILDFYDLSAASFADKIEVGRSSISHILSGRNKPSLDFVMKVVKNFPEVELYWLLNGKGKFPADSDSPAETGISMKDDKSTPSNSIQQPIKNSSPEPPTSFPAGKPGKEIQKIVIFYKDGSFEAFEN